MVTVTVGICFDCLYSFRETVPGLIYPVPNEAILDQSLTVPYFILPSYIISGPFGSCIKRWEMKKEVIQLHERFQQEITHPRGVNYSVYVSNKAKTKEVTMVIQRNRIKNTHTRSSSVDN